MGKYGVFLRGTGPRSLIDPTGQSEEIEGVDARGGPSFEEILEGRLPAGTVKVALDVKATLQAAGIELSPLDLDRLGRGIDKLAEEESQEGLLLSEKAGFVVDVATRTLKAAVPVDEMKEKVFTDIDSAIVVENG
jgi:hypothetical protein